MSNFRLYNPASLQEALILLDRTDNALVLNGGTDAMVSIHNNIISDCSFIYIHDLSELKFIRHEKRTLVLGGATTYKQFENSHHINSFPGMAAALSKIASPPIRNMATFAGNIATASPAADFNVILLAFGGRVELTNIYRERIVQVKDFFLSSNKTIMEHNEIITKIFIPCLDNNQFFSYVKIGRRKGQDLSRVSVSIHLTLIDGICSKIRIAIGAVNPKPFRSYSLEKIMEGKTIKQGLEDISNIFPIEASPRKSYKYHIVNPVVKRAILEAFHQSLGGERYVQTTKI